LRKKAFNELKKDYTDDEWELKLSMKTYFPYF
jgi:hypothetical protein